MLVPALTRKDEIEQKFANEMYSNRFFFYSGYSYGHELPQIKDADYYFQWACVGVQTNEVLGYIAYHIDPASDSVDRFGIYSFDGGNVLFAKDLMILLIDLICKHHRVSWSCISSNPVLKHYSEFCKENGGNEVVLHDVCKDPEGNYVNDHIFEIIRGRKLTVKQKTYVNQQIESLSNYIK